MNASLRSEGYQEVNIQRRGVEDRATFSTPRAARQNNITNFRICLESEINS